MVGNLGACIRLMIVEILGVHETSGLWVKPYFIMFFLDLFM
jgi:hypothetical protein